MHMVPKEDTCSIRTASREVKLMFILHFGSNRSAFYLYMVTSAACSSIPYYIMHMHGYIRGVATVRIYPYPAVVPIMKNSNVT